MTTAFSHRDQAARNAEPDDAGFHQPHDTGGPSSPGLPAASATGAEFVSVSSSSGPHRRLPPRAPGSRAQPQPHVNDQSRVVKESRGAGVKLEQPAKVVPAPGTSKGGEHAPEQRVAVSRSSNIVGADGDPSRVRALSAAVRFLPGNIMLVKMIGAAPQMFVDPRSLMVPNCECSSRSQQFTPSKSQSNHESGSEQYSCSRLRNLRFMDGDR
jgi:hypothetical protein